MDLNELVQSIDELGYQIIMQTIPSDKVIVIIDGKSPIAHLLQDKVNEYYTGYEAFGALSEEKQDELTKLLSTFANTPVEVR
ncbi:hypothetical protein HYO62_05795 [Aerococcaceae bacterium DSM 111022]|nr:hypothetical protein [Aerococcaceae bacterium DSM 111022]